jgi:hypothetical protein
MAKTSDIANELGLGFGYDEEDLADQFSFGPRRKTEEE